MLKRGGISSSLVIVLLVAIIGLFAIFYVTSDGMKASPITGYQVFEGSPSLGEVFTISEGQVISINGGDEDLTLHLQQIDTSPVTAAIRFTAGGIETAARMSVNDKLVRTMGGTSYEIIFVAYPGSGQAQFQVNLAGGTTEGGGPGITIVGDKCNETDAGNVPHLKGITSLFEESMMIQRTFDTCVDASTVQEYYCQKTGNDYMIANELVTCQTSCVNGRCIPAGVEYNDAEFVSQVVPTVMGAGNVHTVVITMNNTGTTTWKTESTVEGLYGHKLGSQVLTGHDLQWGVPRAMIWPIGSEVKPGETHTFSFVIQAPFTPGDYSFNWMMVDEFQEWFGESSEPVTITVAPRRVGPRPIYRFYANVPEIPLVNHFYTTNFAEKDLLVKLYENQVSPYKLEGIEGYIPQWNEPGVTKPIYRLSNENFMDHRYTDNATEADLLIGLGWNFEGPLGFAFKEQEAGTQGLRQFFNNQDGKTYDHFYTINQSINPTGYTEVNSPIGYVFEHRDHATFVSQIVPRTMFDGIKTSVAVTFKNSGESSWTKEEGYKLAYAHPQIDGEDKSPDRWTTKFVELPDGVNVSPGENHTFWFTVKPNTEADYLSFVWRMYHNESSDSRWRFGHRSDEVRVLIQEKPCLAHTFDNGLTKKCFGTASYSVDHATIGTPYSESSGCPADDPLDPLSDNTWLLGYATSNASPEDTCEGFLPIEDITDTPGSQEKGRNLKIKYNTAANDPDKLRSVHLIQNYEGVEHYCSETPRWNKYVLRSKRMPRDPEYPEPKDLATFISMRPRITNDENGHTNFKVAMAGGYKKDSGEKQWYLLNMIVHRKWKGDLIPEDPRVINTRCYSSTQEVPCGSSDQKGRVIILDGRHYGYFVNINDSAQFAIDWGSIIEDLVNSVPSRSLFYLPPEALTNGKTIYVEAGTLTKINQVIGSHRNNLIVKKFKIYDKNKDHCKIQITADPNPCTIQEGEEKCTSHISWFVQDPTEAYYRVVVGNDAVGHSLFACQDAAEASASGLLSKTASASWLRNNPTTFYLEGVDSCDDSLLYDTSLDEVSVSGAYTIPAQGLLFEDGPCAPNAFGVCNTTIKWNTTGINKKAVQIRVGTQDTLFACAQANVPFGKAFETDDPAEKEDIMDNRVDEIEDLITEVTLLLQQVGSDPELEDYLQKLEETLVAFTEQQQKCDDLTDDPTNPQLLSQCDGWRKTQKQTRDWITTTPTVFKLYEADDCDVIPTVNDLLHRISVRACTPGTDCGVTGPTCTDSDGGKRYDVAGSVTVTNPGGFAALYPDRCVQFGSGTTPTFVTSCVAPDCKVEENFCEGDARDSEYVDCVECDSGVCNIGAITW